MKEDTTVKMSREKSEEVKEIERQDRKRRAQLLILDAIRKQKEKNNY